MSEKNYITGDIQQKTANPTTHSKTEMVNTDMSSRHNKTLRVLLIVSACAMALTIFIPWQNSPYTSFWDLFSVEIPRLKFLLVYILLCSATCLVVGIAPLKKPFYRSIVAGSLGLVGIIAMIPFVKVYFSNIFFGFIFEHMNATGVGTISFGEFELLMDKLFPYLTTLFLGILFCAFGLQYKMLKPWSLIGAITCGLGAFLLLLFYFVPVSPKPGEKGGFPFEGIISFLRFWKETGNWAFGVIALYFLFPLLAGLTSLLSFKRYDGSNRDTQSLSVLFRILFFTLLFYLPSVYLVLGLLSFFADNVTANVLLLSINSFLVIMPFIGLLVIGAAYAVLPLDDFIRRAASGGYKSQEQVFTGSENSIERMGSHAVTSNIKSTAPSSMPYPPPPDPPRPLGIGEIAERSGQALDAEEAGDFSRALGLWKQVHDAIPQDNDAKTHMEICREKVQQVIDEHAALWFEEGKQLAEDGDLEGAIARLENVSEEASLHSKAHEEIRNIVEKIKGMGLSGVMALRAKSAARSGRIKEANRLISQAKSLGCEEQRLAPIYVELAISRARRSLHEGDHEGLMKNLAEAEQFGVEKEVLSFRHAAADALNVRVDDALAKADVKTAGLLVRMMAHILFPAEDKRNRRAEYMRNSAQRFSTYALRRSKLGRWKETCAALKEGKDLGLEGQAFNKSCQNAVHEFFKGLFLQNSGDNISKQVLLDAEKVVEDTLGLGCDTEFLRNAILPHASGMQEKADKMMLVRRYTSASLILSILSGAGINDKDTASLANILKENIDNNRQKAKTFSRMRFWAIVGSGVIGCSIVIGIFLWGVLQKKKIRNMDPTVMVRGSCITTKKLNQVSEKQNICAKTLLVDRYEVTRTRYEMCVDAGVCRPVPAPSAKIIGRCGSKPDLLSNYPITNVSFNDAGDYCRWVDKRLPSFLELEHAAYKGKSFNRVKTAISTDQTEKLRKANLWGAECRRAGDDSSKEKITTNSFGLVADLYKGLSVVNPPNAEDELGIYFLIGNAAEWTISKAEKDDHRYVFGGSWFTDFYYIENLYRTDFPENYRSPSLGFRCVKEVKK